jgi:hypothetical protein
MPLYLKVIKDMLIGNTKYVQYCTVLELAAGSLKNEGSEEIGQRHRQEETPRGAGSSRTGSRRNLGY